MGLSGKAASCNFLHLSCFDELSDHLLEIYAMNLGGAIVGLVTEFQLPLQDASRKS